MGRSRLSSNHNPKDLHYLGRPKEPERKEKSTVRRMKSSSKDLNAKGSFPSRLRKTSRARIASHLDDTRGILI